jgi:hypothetical protein
MREYKTECIGCQKQTEEGIKEDGLVSSPKSPFSVIPAKAGIQFLHKLTKHMGSGDPVPAKAGNRSDDFYESIKGRVGNKLTKKRLWNIFAFTRLRRKPRPPGRGGMRVSSDLSGEASAKSEAS